MNMNDAMRALVGETVREVELHSELRPYAQAPHVVADNGALLNVALARSPHANVGYATLSAYEASINQIYIDDFVEGTLVSLIQQAVAFARCVSRSPATQGRRMRFVIATNGTGCSVCYSVHRDGDSGEAAPGEPTIVVT